VLVSGSGVEVEDQGLVLDSLIGVVMGVETWLVFSFLA
jgi:hypothetical protein